MKTTKVGLHPTARLEMGTAILAAAQVVDVKSVRPRLAAFARAHRNYLAAQHKVDAASARLSALQAEVAGLDAKQDGAVEALARSLIYDGNMRRNPFIRYGSATPSDIKELASGEETRAIRKLVAAVQADRAASAATLRAARAAGQAARAVEAALPPLNKAEAAVRTAREARDHIGRTWQAALTALKHGARAADDDGGPALSTALFGGLRRSKKGTATVNPEPVVPPVAPPAPPATASA